MTRGRRAIIYLVAGLVMGANLGAFIALALRWLAYALLFVAEIGGLTFGIYKLRRKSAQGKTQAQKDAVGLLTGLVAGQILGLLSAPFWLYLTYGQTVPLGYLGQGTALGVALSLAVMAYHFYFDFLREFSVKTAESKIADSRRLLIAENLKDSEERLREALLEVEMRFGSVHAEVAKVVQEIGRYFAKTKEYEKAGSMFRRALETFEKVYGKTHRALGLCLLDMGALEGQTQPKKGEELLRRGLTIVDEFEGPDSLDSGRIHFALAQALSKQGEYKEAEAHCRRAMLNFEKSNGTSDPEYNLICGRLVSYCVKLRLFTDAEKILKKILADREAKGLAPDGELVNLVVETARIHTAQRQTQEAQQAYLRALDLIRNDVGPDHALQKEILENCKPVMADIPNAPHDFAAYVACVIDNDMITFRKKTDADKALINTPDGTGWTALQWAVYLTYEKMLDSLVFGGAEINPGQSLQGMPPLLIAARWGLRKTMQTLIGKGANVNAADERGWTPLHCAAASNDDRLLDPLMQKQANLGAVDNDGHTPLHIAAIRGNTRMVVELIGRGADKNVQAEPTGKTALHLAVELGHRSVVECLCFNGADATIADKSGKTALDMAREANQSELVKLMEG